jgi:cytidine deaminase
LTKKLATTAARRAYAPYSGFRVGAVLEDERGRLHQGCNIECASLGLSICAERSALSLALAAGAKRFRRLWIYTPTEQPIAPCGACREMLRHFAGDLEVTLLCRSEASRRFKLDDLLPGYPDEEE